MLIYYFSLYKVLDQIQTKSALLLLHNAQDDQEEQLKKQLLDEINNLISNIKLYEITSTVSYKNIQRHISFAINYNHLIDNNINDIFSKDVPELKAHLDKYFYNHLDADLFSQTKDLFLVNYSAAIQRAFIVLTKRIRHSKYVSNTTLDGVQLCDHLFSSNGENKLPIEDENKKRYLKNLLSSSYSLFRNQVSHEPNITLEEADTAFSIINYILKTLEI